MKGVVILILAFAILGCVYFLPGALSTPTTPFWREPTRDPEREKTVTLFNSYSIQVPSYMKVSYQPVSNVVSAPMYHFEWEDRGFSVILHPYKVSAKAVPGKCVVSNELDSGSKSASLFCEGFTMTEYFPLRADMFAKYGSLVDDQMLECKPDQPELCPVKPEERYSKGYVFVVPDKSRGNILEIFAEPSAFGPTPTISGFEGVSGLLHDSILPTLTVL